MSQKMGDFMNLLFVAFSAMNFSNLNLENMNIRTTMTYEVRHQVHTGAIKVRPRVHIATLPNCKCSTMLNAMVKKLSVY